MQEPICFIGVDVSKAELVISIDAGRPHAVRNEPQSIRRLLSQLPSKALIAMESTGRYHGLLAHLAVQAGFTVFVLNARDVYFYARALGSRAKTDAVDAVLIAHYLAQHHARLHPWQAASPLLQQL